MLLAPTRRPLSRYHPRLPGPATANAALVAPVASYVYSTTNAIRISWTNATGGYLPYAYDVYRNASLLAANQTSPYDDSSVSTATIYTYTVKVNDSKPGGAQVATSNSVTGALPYDGSGGSGSGSRITGILLGGRL